MAMHGGGDAVASLSASFTGGVVYVDDIAPSVTGAERASMVEDLRASLLVHCAGLQGGILRSIVAFRLYDRLSQRLTMARRSIATGHRSTS